jgi:hypothetical protein
MTVIHRVQYTYQKTKHFAPVSDPKELAKAARPAQMSIPEAVATSAINHHH